MIAQRLHKLLTQMDICEIEASMAIHQLIMALKNIIFGMNLILYAGS